MSNEYFVAKQLSEIDRHEEAIQYLLRVTPEDPMYVDSLNLLAWCYYKLGRYREAIASSDQTLHESPQLPHAHVVRALIYHASALGHWPKTIDYAISLNPHSAYAHYVRAFCFSRVNLWDEALPSIQEAVRLNPNPTNLNLLSFVLANQGKVDVAAEVNASVLQLDPEYSSGYEQQGRILNLSEKPEAALAQLLESLRLDPGSKTAKRELMQAAKMHYWPYRMNRRFARWLKRIPVLGLTLTILLPYTFFGLLGEIPALKSFSKVICFSFLGTFVAIVFGFVAIELLACLVVAADRRFATFVRPQDRRSAYRSLICLAMSLSLVGPALWIRNDPLFVMCLLSFFASAIFGIPVCFPDKSR